MQPKPPLTMEVSLLPKETGVLLRIANGGAGQIGLIGALANAFVQDWAAKGYNPFEL